MSESPKPIIQPAMPSQHVRPHRPNRLAAIALWLAAGAWMLGVLSGVVLLVLLIVWSPLFKGVAPSATQEAVFTTMRVVQGWMLPLSGLTGDHRRAGDALSVGGLGVWYLLCINQIWLAPW